MAVTCIDWGQTRYISTHGNQYYENNPILGRHPSLDKVNTLVPLGIIGHAVIAAALPKHYTIFGFDVHPRLIWQGVWIGIEIDAVASNFKTGIKYEF